jgi:N-methylhydantoinase B/oxoprolinase/acetone carboxylase alpha subunit
VRPFAGTATAWITAVEASMNVTALPGKATMTVPQGALIVHEQAGGGGYGDPRERDAGLVREDVADGKISREFAREYHGLDINGPES